MKKIVFVFCLLLFSVFAYGQSGVTCYTIPAVNLPTGTNASYRQMATDSSGKILICSNGAGIIVFDGVNYSNFLTSNSGIASNNTIDISTSATNYYIATQNDGLSVFDGNNWTTYDSLNSGLNTNQPNCVLAHGGKAYIGTKKNGFSILNNGIIATYTKANSGLSCDTIYDFAIDNIGNLWILTGREINKFDGFNFTSFTIPGTLVNYNITSFYCDGNELWFHDYNSGSTKLYKLENNSIVNALNAIDVCSDILYGYYGKPLCKGPLGGVLIHSAYDYKEIFNNRIYSHYLLGTNCFYNSTNSFFFYDKKTKLIWNKGYKFELSSMALDSFSPHPLLQSQNCRSLDVNNVKAAMLNRGDMFWNLSDIKYEVPKGSGKHSVFASSLWIGGLDPGRNLHLAAMTYRQSGCDFWPGPLDTITGTIDTATSLIYDKIWKVDKFQIERFKYFFQIGSVQNGKYTPADDILSWPAHGSGNYTRSMAPFVDLNQDGIYNPLTGGDYPLIKGDQMLYWIFNDNLAFHNQTQGQALKVEVQASAYAYACPGLTSQDSIVNYTTFYNYKLFNRSNLNYDSCYISTWTDYDLGNSNDDLVGTHAANNFVYSCNLDSNDEGNGTNHYGINPPIMSNVILNGPLAYLNDTIDNDNNGTKDEVGEKNLLTNTLAYHGNFTVQGPPETAQAYYYFIQSKWKDGLPLTYGGGGHLTGNPTKYMYPDFPSDTLGWFQPTHADDRIIASSGPFLFPAGSSFEYDFAFVFSRDTTLNFNSPAYYNMAVSDVQRIKSWFDNNNAPSCLVFPGIKENTAQKNNLLLFPNPSNNSIQIQFENSTEINEYAIFDLLGKQVKASDLNAHSNTFVRIDVSSFTTGIYFVLAKDKSGNGFYKKFVRE